MKACAYRRGETQAEWLARAVETQARIEAGGEPAPREALDLMELRRIMEAACALAESSGVALPKTAARHWYALLTQRLHDALPASAGDGAGEGARRATHDP
jgi:hypothetical protein